MRSLIVRILAIALSFYVTSHLISGFKLEQSWQSYLIASAVFLLFNMIAGPIVKLLLLPINLLTLGLFRWLSNVIVLYLFDAIYNGLTITSYRFPGFSSGLFALPAMNLNLFWVLVISSFTLSLSYSLVSSLLKSD